MRVLRIITESEGTDGGGLRDFRESSRLKEGLRRLLTPKGKSQ